MRTWAKTTRRRSSPTGITDLEQTINTHLTEIRTEVSLAAARAAQRRTGQVGSAPPLGDLEEQLARAVTVSLSAALEAIRESLTDAVASAVAHSPPGSKRSSTRRQDPSSARR